MADEGQVVETGPRRRRRRSGGSKSKAAPTGLIGILRAPHFGKILFAAMTLFALAYVWQIYSAVEGARTRLGPVALGQTESEARFNLGPTDEQHPDAATTVLRRDGRTFTLALAGADRRVAGISCREDGVAPQACPDLLGVRIGAGRERVLEALGRGDVGHAGTSEVLTYPALGARLELADARVAAITVGAVPVDQGAWRVVLWRLLP